MIRFVIAPNPGPYTLDGTRSYVVDDEIVIDPGPDVASHVDALLSAAPRLRKILVTHRHADHAPAAQALASRSGAAIHAPEGVLPGARSLREGERFDASSLSLEAIATPGHTDEHFCFLTSAGDLFTGDTVLGEGTSTIFPPDGDMSKYLDTLAKLKSRAPQRIWPGHGPMRDDAVALLDGYIRHRLEREQQIIDAMQSGASTIIDIRTVVYPELHPALHTAAETQIYAHLLRLAELGRLTGVDPTRRRVLDQMIRSANVRLS